MRARMAIIRAGLVCEHREVVLRDRPEHMMEISPKGTVPVMLLPSGKVIEESLEIMQYVANWTLTDLDNHWVNRNDNEFKFHLDRYKYPNRYVDVDELEQRELAKKYLDDLDQLLLKSLSDELNDALFPFVRQFANHDREWFDKQQWDNLGQWLADNLSGEEFKICMKKYPQWFAGDAPVTFPITE
jgi:glutathione S-transferase